MAYGLKASSCDPLMHLWYLVIFSKKPSGIQRFQIWRGSPFSRSVQKKKKKKKKKERIGNDVDTKIKTK